MPIEIRTYIDFLHTVEKLKCRTRHSFTTNGRQESVADHTCRLALMALLCADNYPELDMNRVIRMCLVHDLGEAVTGDIPSFEKTDADERTEREAIADLLGALPEPTRSDWQALFAEMEARTTPEAKLWKALDNMEAVLSHNEADLSTWIPLEYSLNLTYGEENAAFSPFTAALRQELRADTERKLDAVSRRADADGCSDTGGNLKTSS